MSGHGYTPRCDRCGRFFQFEQPGSSWGRYWSYDMSGCPELHDPIERCARCTDTLGEVGTNCHGDGYAGIYPAGGVETTPADQPTGDSQDAAPARALG